MIKFYGVSSKLQTEIDRLKHYYPNYVIIEPLPKSSHLKQVTINDGIPIIIKYYGMDGMFRIGLGSYLSELISQIDYISMEIS